MLPVLCLVGSVCASGMGASSPATTETVPEGSAAMDLVRAVRQSEQWVHELKGARFQFEGKWKRSPEAIAFNWKELRSRLPDADLTPERFEGLRAESSERLEITFDRFRFKLMNRRQGGPFACC